MCLLKFINISLGKLEKFLLVTFLTTIVILQTVQIISREFFNHSFIWIGPLLRSIILWLALIGGAKCVESRKHIKIDLVEKLFSSQRVQIIQRLLALLSSIICLFLFLFSIPFIQIEKEASEIAFLNVPLWIIELAFPIGFLFMTIHFLFLVFYREAKS